ncbi:hypothetical protein G7074_15655 [Pedobacter sp. HDW13]|uniref:hypothetical protein n=1 Tax=Pedobacter sp. HDW13 TaxID=2714940 RepID=UPI00140D8414|nr:hypothetical protein [Pedobacter sp. HDW13]QIL40575.1 hypothetical protein G7074_15655 [Pedobacter sp. HDW13]
MPDKIFYVIDNFCPTSYYDQSFIKNDMFYVIVNTYIINTDNFKECPLLADYLDPATQLSSYTWEYLGNNAAAAVEIQKDPSCLVPVPPPINIPFSFSFNATTLDNKLGYEFSSAKDIIEWIRQSNSSLVVSLLTRKTGINYFNYITFPQLITLNKWLTALLTEIFRKEPANIIDALERKIYDCLWTGIDANKFRENFLELIEKEQGGITSKAKLPLGITDFYLTKYCNLLVAENVKTDSSFAPDPLKLEPEALDLLIKTPAEAKAELGDEKNYRKILCQKISTEKKDPSKLAERLQFYYGAGERVRANGAVTISMMMIKDIDTPSGMQLNTDGTPTGWIETNAYSFCGQVAAIPLAEVRDGAFTNSFTINAGGMKLLDMLTPKDRKEYFESIRAHLHNIDNNDHTKLKRSLSLPATYSVDQITRIQEKTNYYPVNALLEHNFKPYTVVFDQDQFATAIKMPEALLDTLVDKPKVSYQDTSTDTAFIKLNPQRMLLREEDLFKDDRTNAVKLISMENSVALNQFRPAIILSVLVKKVKLPQEQKEVYKISRKAYVPITNTDPAAKEVLMELKELRELLYAPDNSLRKDDFAFRVRKLKPKADIVLKDIWTDGKIDDDEMIELYADGLKTLFEDGNSKGIKDTVEADLVIIPIVANISNMFKHGFNLLLHKDPGQKVFIALDKHYQFRFNVSINGFSRSMQLKLDKDGFVNSGLGNVEPLLFDYSNFNKFRISLMNGEELKLNTNDALFPVGENNPDKLPTNFYYRTTHRFAEEVSAKSTDDAQENRYKLYRLNANALSLKAKIENQYAFRLAVEQNGIHFPYSNPIRNIGDLKTTKVEDELVSVIPLLRYAVSDKNDQIILILNKKYLKGLLRNIKDQDEAQMTVYRNLYEAFFDAINNQCLLCIELWNFNNMLHTLDDEYAAHPESSNEWPSLMKHLEKVKTVSFPVNFTNMLTPFNKSTFAGFKKAVEEYTDGTDEYTEKINLSSSLSAEILKTNLLRLGLSIVRAEDKTIRVQFNNGVPVASDLRPFPLGSEDELGSDFAFGRIEEPRKALEAYLDTINMGNPLFNSFTYICSNWYDDNKPAAGTGADKRKNIKELLGETTSFIWIPKGSAPNTTDMLLYYVPYSFRPLQVHSKLIDLKTTIGFSEYLLRILVWLAYPEKQKENPENFLVDINVLNDMEKLFKIKLQARDKILPAIASKLAALLTYVDNRPLASTDAHYKLVTDITNRLQDSILKAFRSVLIEDPMKYITAKGFGLGLFSGVSTKHINTPIGLPRDGEMQDLYMLQLIKDIRKPLPQNSGTPLKGSDTTRINFKAFLDNTSAGITERYFIENLEDALYDNEFQIMEASNAISEPFDASQVRTAEDMLENTNRFNEQVPTGNAAKFAVAHYCPDWRTDEDEKFYLLPSRTPPSIPVPYIPTQPMMRREEKGDWKRLVMDRSGELSLDFGTQKVIFEHPAHKNWLTYNKDIVNIEKKYSDRWDIFINTYDYIVDPDEEGDLSNDLFEIFLAHVNESSMPLKRTAFTLTDIPETMLFKQFEKYVRKKDEPISALDLEKLVPLDGTIGEIESLLNELLVAGIGDDSGSTADVQLRKKTNDTFELIINPNFALRERVLSAEVFRVKGEPDHKPVKHLIRIKILGDPWSHYRCRLRVRRNMRDVAGDGRFDINPAFVINSAYSTWTDYGIQSLHYDYLADVGNAEDWDPALKYLAPTTLSYKEYVAMIKNVQAGNPIQFGMLLLEHLNIHNKLFKLTEMVRKERLFNAYVEEKIRSATPQLFHKSKQVDSILAYKKMATDSLAKSGVTKIAADMINTFRVVPHTIRSHEPIIHYFWYSIEDSTKVVFTLSLKLKLK